MDGSSRRVTACPHSWAGGRALGFRSRACPKEGHADSLALAACIMCDIVFACCISFSENALFMSSAHFLWDFILSFSLLELSIQTGGIRSLSVVYFSQFICLFYLSLTLLMIIFFFQPKVFFLIFKICYKMYQSLFSFASGF